MTGDNAVRPTHFPEVHQQGRLSIENDEAIRTMDLTDCDVGIQVSHDGRIWLCVNSVAWIRFKPQKWIDMQEPKGYYDNYPYSDDMGAKFVPYDPQPCPNQGRYNDCHGTGRYWYDEDTPMAGQIPAGWRTCAAGCKPPQS